MSMKLLSCAAIAFLVGVFLSGCSSEQSGDDEPGATNSVQYTEFADQIVKMVHLDLDDCSLVLRQGPESSITGNSATCTESELQRAHVLLEDWSSYVGLTPADLQTAEPAAANGGGGGMLNAESAGAETSCNGGSDCDSEPAGNLGDISGTSDMGTDGTVSITMDGTKVFWADSTGPEQDLIEFFRGLHSKYGEFD